MPLEMGKDAGNPVSTDSADWTGCDERTAEDVEQRCGITLVPPGLDV